MAKDKPKNPDQEGGKEDPQPSHAELERRIAILEKSVSDLPAAQLDRHLKTITIIFQCFTGLIAVCALLVTLMGYWSKSEAEQESQRLEARVAKATEDYGAQTKQAIRDSVTQTKEAIADMQAQFDKLAGDSLKRPFITISNEFWVARWASDPFKEHRRSATFPFVCKKYR